MHTTRLSDVGVDGGENQLPTEDGQRPEAEQRHHERELNVSVGDAEDGSEQEGVDPGRAARVQAEEKQAQAQREGEDRADGSRLRAMTGIEVAAHPSDAERCRDAEGDQAENRRDVHEHGAGRAWEADLGKHVRGKALASEHHEVPGRPGEQRDEGARNQRVLHEVVLQQQLDVGEQIPRHQLSAAW